MRKPGKETLLEGFLRLPETRFSQYMWSFDFILGESLLEGIYNVCAMDRLIFHLGEYKLKRPLRKLFWKFVARALSKAVHFDAIILLLTIYLQEIILNMENAFMSADVYCYNNEKWNQIKFATKQGNLNQ